MPEQDRDDKFFEMMQEIREKLISVETKLEYSQQGQNEFKSQMKNQMDEMKSQINEINKKLEQQNIDTGKRFEEENSKIQDIKNEQNNLADKFSKWEKWGGVVVTPILIWIVTNIWNLIAKR